MIVEAMVRHGWWSLRGRFWMALVVVVAHAVGVVFLYGRYGGTVPADWELASEDRAGVEATLGATYVDYLRVTWAGGDLGGLLAVLAIALCVGGAAAERRESTADFTLSLPVSRSRWLLVRAGLCMALLLLLASVSAGVVVLGGIVADATSPLAPVAAATLLAGLGPAYAVALALATTTVTRDAIGAAVLALAVLYVLDGSGVLAAWHPSVLLDVRSWTAGPPWRPILAASFLAGGFLLIAIRRFDRVDA